MNIVIILSGGVGSRIGDEIPKQYILVNNWPIISYSLKIFLQNENTDEIIIVTAQEWKDYVEGQVELLNEHNKHVYYAKAGSSRLDSVYNALVSAKEHGADNEDIIMIHESARPLIKDDLINRCFMACKDVDGVLPVVPVKNSIYYSTDGNIISGSLDRSKLWSGQAPEIFTFGKYYKAHSTIPRDEIQNMNGCAEVAFKSGLKIKMIYGDPMNFKITTREDLLNFEGIIHDSETSRINDQH